MCFNSYCGNIFKIYLSNSKSEAFSKPEMKCSEENHRIKSKLPPKESLGYMKQKNLLKYF
jgi:hypothetical protein